MDNPADNEKFALFKDLLDVQFFPVANQFLLSKAHTRAIFAGNQGGKCILEGTPVQLSDGHLVPIERVSVGDHVVSLGDDLRLSNNRVMRVIDSGKQGCWCVETRSGRSVIVTLWHPFRTVKGWEALSQLSIGDYIAIPRTLNISCGTDVEGWKYIVSGYLIGDGGLTGGSIRFSNIDPLVLNDLSSVLPTDVTLRKVSGDNCDYSITGGRGKKNNSVLSFCREIGLYGKNSHQKFVPEFVHGSSNAGVSLFLSRLFSCDGWVSRGMIGYASVSRRLIDGIAALLLRFGIVAGIHRKKNCYELSIRRTSDIRTFADNIGIFSKQDKVLALLDTKEQTPPKENRDTIPINVLPLKTRLSCRPSRQGGYVGSDRGLHEMLRGARGKTITRPKAAMIAEAFCCLELMLLAKSDVFWDEITGIYPCGNEQTYDIEVENAHSFIANNIFVHNTTMAMADLVMRLLKIHPIPGRNRINHPIRLVSKVVPQGDSDEENPQYVEIKRRLPSLFIKKDVTARSKFMTVRDPAGGSDMKLEFMAKTQDLDAFMGVQRSAHYQDEEIERIKWDESQMRLLKDGGDSVVTLTPVKGLDWMFDAIWKRSRRVYRTKTICDRFGLPVIQKGEESSGIESFCWATDDNPVMDAASLDRIFRGIDDPDELAMRRYGVFRQVSGRIYKSFDPQIHIVPAEKVFDPSLFQTYWHYRVIDYHPAKKWYISWVAISPYHEWFVWHELLGNHDAKTTYDLRDEIKGESLVDEDSELNRATIIDPLAKVKQPNTGYSVFDDLGRGEFGLRRLTPADTKNTNGRLNIKTRLKNALVCGVPGNNANKKSGEDPRYGNRLPTLWILDHCRGHIEHLNSWRYVDWKQEHVKAVKEVKRASEKYSDFCRNLEFLGALNPVFYTQSKNHHWEASKLFQGQRGR